MGYYMRAAKAPTTKQYKLVATHRSVEREWDVAVCHCDTLSDALDIALRYERDYKDTGVPAAKLIIRRES